MHTTLQLPQLTCAPAWLLLEHCLCYSNLAEARSSGAQVWLVIGAGRHRERSVHLSRAHSAKSLSKAMDTSVSLYARGTCT